MDRAHTTIILDCNFTAIGTALDIWRRVALHQADDLYVPSFYSVKNSTFNKTREYFLTN